MSFWTEQDVFHYIYKYNIDIAPVYGDVVVENQYDRLIRMPLLDTADIENQVDYDSCRLCTTGCRRTGCIFCGYGVHLEKGETRFQRLKRTHPKQYDYCIGGGSYDPDDGMWKPDKNGLGMAHVFDGLNKIYGDNFIRYR